MQYLNSTLTYLQRENEELKAKLKQMMNINQLITIQLQKQDQTIINTIHQKEIQMLKQISRETEINLNTQIKKLKTEINQLNQSITKEIQINMQCRRQNVQLSDQIVSLEDQISNQRLIMNELKSKCQNLQRLEQQKQNKIVEEYKQREEQIMDKCMQKIDEEMEKGEEAIRTKERQIGHLQMKIGQNAKDKELLQSQIEALNNTLQQQQIRKNAKISQIRQELQKVISENNQLTLTVSKLQSNKIELQSNLQESLAKQKSLSSSLKDWIKRYQRLQQQKNSQILKQKGKSKSILENLSAQKKCVENELSKYKKKHRVENETKKELMNKVKQISGKYESQKLNLSLSATQKKGCESQQSISIDNSFTTISQKGHPHRSVRQSPTVSCFKLKDSDLWEKSKRKHLKLENGQEWNRDDLKINDLDTPCFESGGQKTIKRMIKIKK